MEPRRLRAGFRHPARKRPENSELAVRNSLRARRAVCFGDCEYECECGRSVASFVNDVLDEYVVEEEDAVDDAVTVDDEDGCRFAIVPAMLLFGFFFAVLSIATRHETFSGPR